MRSCFKSRQPSPRPTFLPFTAFCGPPVESGCRVLRQPPCLEEHVVTGRPAAVVVLAAGEGTRMKSATAKVLHGLGCRSMLGPVVAAARALDPEHLVVVVGHSRDQVIASLASLDPTAIPVVQAEQNGTGHAVRVAL